MSRGIKQTIIDWISNEPVNTDFPLCDFERIRYEVRPCDVLLIEGHSRVSNVIKQITQSSWSHSCVYIGRLHDVDDINLRRQLADHFNGPPNVQLVIEGYLGKGTIVSPLESYHADHIRICRPRGLSRKDAQSVIAFTIEQLGKEYDVRQIFDLARFLIPWSILPGRWRSSLFQKNIGQSTKTVCSTMIAQAFESVDFPILPLVKQHEETGIELIKVNTKLFTPRDFDYSPFFEIIKYPFIELSEHGTYRNLPWNRSGLISPDGESIVDENPITSPEKVKLNKTPNIPEPDIEPILSKESEDTSNDISAKLVNTDAPESEDSTNAPDDLNQIANPDTQPLQNEEGRSSTQNIIKRISHNLAEKTAKKTS